MANSRRPATAIHASEVKRFCPSELSDQEIRTQIASESKRIFLCTEKCSQSYRPSGLDFLIAEINGREYWSYARMSDMELSGNSFRWLRSCDQAEASRRLSANYINDRVIEVKQLNESHRGHDFIKANKHRYCTPYDDETGLSWFPNWEWSYESVVTGPISLLEDCAELSPIGQTANPEHQIGLKLRDSAPIFAYRANDSPEAFAEAILLAYESAFCKKLNEKNVRFDGSTACFDSWVSSKSPELDYYEKTRILRAAFKAAVSEIASQGHLPDIFYKLSSDQYTTYIGSGRVSDERVKGISDAPWSDNQNSIITSFAEYYFYSSGLSRKELIQDFMPANACEIFGDTLLRMVRLKRLKRIKRNLRCSDTTFENRLSLALSFARSIQERSRLLGAKPVSAELTRANIMTWLDLNGERIAEMILDFQLSFPDRLFHIDHVVPLAALPDAFISDIASMAWHPSNLAVIPEEDNLAKGSIFEGKSIRRKTLDDATQRRAIAALLNGLRNFNIR